MYCVLKSGGLMSGGLLSGELFSGGLMSAHQSGPDCRPTFFGGSKCGPL